MIIFKFLICYCSRVKRAEFCVKITAFEVDKLTMRSLELKSKVHASISWTITNEEYECIIFFVFLLCDLETMIKSRPQKNNIPLYIRA